jgi:hypothetical protein
MGTEIAYKLIKIEIYPTNEDGVVSLIEYVEMPDQYCSSRLIFPLS